MTTMKPNGYTRVVANDLLEAHACSGWAETIDMDDIDSAVAAIDMKAFAKEEYHRWFSKACASGNYSNKPCWLNIAGCDAIKDVDWKYVKQVVVDYYQKFLRMEFDNGCEEGDPINE